jgi:SAM-dependent methyltransferase
VSSDRVWAGEMSAAYDELLVPTVFQPFADDLAARIAQRAPARVLELAAGTGVLTKAIAAALPDAAITATDLNVAMVDYGATRVPAATWQQADAMSLPFDAASFDLVACQFGVMFLPDTPAAYAGVRRVLAPGGTFLANVWGPIDGHDFERVVTDAVCELYPDDPPTFLADTPHGYADPDRITADLAAGGFVCTAFDTITLRGTAPSAVALARGYCTGTPLRAQLEARGDLASAIAAVTAALEDEFGTGPISGAMVVHVFAGELPNSA